VGRIVGHPAGSHAISTSKSSRSSNADYKHSRAANLGFNAGEGWIHHLKGRSPCQSFFDVVVIEDSMRFRLRRIRMQPTKTRFPRFATYALGSPMRGACTAIASQALIAIALAIIFTFLQLPSATHTLRPCVLSHEHKSRSFSGKWNFKKNIANPQGAQPLRRVQ